MCDALSQRAPETFHEAVQASWFLYVILQMESNASSFSPGRMDQYLYPYCSPGNFPLVAKFETGFTDRIIALGNTASKIL